MMDSWRNLWNKHKDQAGIVIGNGPSLKTVPNEWLQKYPTFGTNRIYLKEGFTPTYHVCVNPLVQEQFGGEIHRMNCLKFATHLEGPDVLRLQSVNLPVFSFAPDEWIFEGWTVTFVALQLAYFMGFNTVLLIGVDHRYDFSGNPNEQKLMTGDDPNHFDPNYFKGAQWNNPDLERSEASYEKAKLAFEGTGRTIINLGPDSALEVFPKGVPEEWF